MKDIPIKLGPLALLLTVVRICLSILAILTVTTARADLRLAEKFAATVEQRYALEAEGQSFLRDLNERGLGQERLSPGEDGLYRLTLERDGAVVRLELARRDGAWECVSWVQEKEWVQDPLIEGLWLGD